MRTTNHDTKDTTEKPSKNTATSTSGTTRKKYVCAQMPSHRATTDYRREGSKEKQASKEGKQQEQNEPSPSTKQTVSKQSTASMLWNEYGHRSHSRM